MFLTNSITIIGAFSILHCLNMPIQRVVTYFINIPGNSVNDCILIMMFEPCF